MQSTKISRKVAGLMAATVMVATASAVKADGPTVSGYIDTQYVYSFNQPNTQAIMLRSFDAKDNNISLNAAQLNVSGTFGETAGYTVKFLAGLDAGLLTSVGSGAADDFDLQEAYLWNKFASGLGFKVGKFVTFQGIEVIESKDNATISRGYLFGLAEPFTHVGGVATYATGAWDFAAGVVNGWDITSDNNTGKTAVGKATMNLGDPLMVTVSATHGPEQAGPGTNGNNRTSVDLTGVTKIIPMTALWFQLNGGEEENIVDLDGDTIVDDTAKWKGFTVQPIVSITDKFSVGARGEYFYDDDGARTGTVDLAAKNFTITPAYKTTENTTVRLEYRYDTANKKIWADEDGTLKDTSNTVSAQFLLTF